MHDQTGFNLCTKTNKKWDEKHPHLGEKPFWPVWAYIYTGSIWKALCAKTNKKWKKYGFYAYFKHFLPVWAYISGHHMWACGHPFADPCAHVRSVSIWSSIWSCTKINKKWGKCQDFPGFGHFLRKWAYIYRPHIATWSWLKTNKKWDQMHCGLGQKRFMPIWAYIYGDVDRFEN